MSSAVPSTPRRRILLVEDNEDNCRIYCAMLRHVGFDVIEAHDGAEGLLAMQTQHPDLVIMDVSVPTIDGWEVTRQAKRDPAIAGIPILAVTAHALPSDREKAAEVGCSGYLAKPVEPRVVANLVADLLAVTTP
jgi:two-component system, cell cycle response regulator DivK